MNAILGFDIDGRPLRAGDDVIIEHSSIPGDTDIGKVCKVLGRCPLISDQVEISIPHPSPIHDWWSCLPRSLRKINTGHLPAPQTYEQLINSLKGETA